jgi:photosystem II stability/assembly factor-like uncharacterized protein
VVIVTGLLALPAALLPSPRAEAAGDGSAAPNTWVPTQALPVRGNGTVLALAVDPHNPQRVVAGTTGGAIDLSTDAGGSWRTVRSGLAGGVLALAFDPFMAGVVLAGTGDAGLWVSKDGGDHWSRATGGGAAPVRAFAFAPHLTLVGTDHGVWTSSGIGPWSPAGLEGVAVSALAVVGGGDQPQVVAGGDAGGEVALPLYHSSDGARTWTPFTGAIGASTMVAALATVPVPGGGTPRLLLGTNAGLFASDDEGATWQQLTSDGVLPPTTFTAVGFAPQRPQRLYVASDGGGSSQGGLWVSDDGGTHFTSLQPPAPSVTALAVADGSTPLLYAAILQPTDQVTRIWSYQDAGGPPGRAQRPQDVARGLPTTHPSGPVLISARDRLVAWLRHPEAPYVGLGGLALLVVLLALVTYVRRERLL